MHHQHASERPHGGDLVEHRGLEGELEVVAQPLVDADGIANDLGSAEAQMEARLRPASRLARP